MLGPTKIMTRMNSMRGLIRYDPHPRKFWKVLFGYSYHYDEGLSPKKIDEYFDVFIEKYLKYKNTSVSSMLDYFDEMCDHWLNKKILKKDKLEVEQKVIEVLTVHRGITLKELVQRTGASEDEVKKSLTTYTLTSYRPIDKWIKLTKRSQYRNFYWRMLLHSIVVTKYGDSRDDKTYELSLFGIILALAIVSYNNQHRLRHGLHYHTLRFENYCDRIVSNYADKLPLIFGKWNLLKQILKHYSAYNFDIIFDKQFRRYSTRISVIDGGNKELVESFRKMVYHNYRQISEIIKQGQLVQLNLRDRYLKIATGGQQNVSRYYLKDYNNFQTPIDPDKIRFSIFNEENKELVESFREIVSVFGSSLEDRYPDIFTGGQQNVSRDYLEDNNIDLQTPLDLHKIHNVRKKLDELRSLLNPFYQNNETTPDKLNMILKVSVRFEEEFAKEITVLYYLHLYSERGLSLLFKKDVNKPLLSEWFYNLIDEINNLQKEVYNALPKRPT